MPSAFVDYPTDTVPSFPSPDELDKYLNELTAAKFAVVTSMVLNTLFTEKPFYTTNFRLG